MSDLSAYRTPPLPFQRWLPATANRVVAVTLLKSDPLVAWNAAKLNLSNGQVEQALSQFSLATVEHYRALILTLGTAEVIQSMGAVGQLTPIYVGDEDAQYYFTTSVGGQDLVFPVTLVRENGQWRIRRF